MRVTLDQARALVPLHVAGHTVKVVRASSASATLTVKIEDNDGIDYPLQKGAGWTHIGFTVLWLTNSAQAGEWVELAWSGRPDQADAQRSTYYDPTNVQDVAINGTVNAIITGFTAGPLEVEPVGGVFFVEPTLTPLADLDWEGVEIGTHTTSTSYVTVYTVPAGKQLTIRRARVSSSHLGFHATAAIFDDGDTLRHAARFCGYAGLSCFEGLTIPEGWMLKVKSENSGEQGNLGVEAYLESV